MKTNLDKLREDIITEFMNEFNCEKEEIIHLVSVDRIIDLIIKKDRKAILKDMKETKEKYIEQSHNPQWWAGFLHAIDRFREILKGEGK